ncbi:MAG TPA: cation:proton antiporter [Mycobacteriales bacterium]|nr:cation:proton antiporter [Mycobacteriales bacterium]
MSGTYHYGLIILLIAAVGLAAVASNRLTEHVKVPVPLLMLVGAAIAVSVVPSLHSPDYHTVERVVTLALVLILFDGGMHIGWSRFRAAAGPIVVVGVAGTFLTAAAGAVLLHGAFGLTWYVALLVATAVAPTDPAVVFSVLGQREIAGRSSTILEGESGANDPVGIALMASLITAGSLTGSAAGHIAVEFLLQMGIGGAVGIAGGLGLLWFMRRIPLPSESLYPLRTMISAYLLYGVATVAHGSGFLAVFVAGILLGDPRAPYKNEITRFHAALGSLAEIVAFVVLGLTIDLHVLTRANVWVPGLVLAVALTLIIRPLLVGLCLIPARLRRTENTFVVLAGLKGAVPILLGVLIHLAHPPEADRLYGIVVVVVVFSVLVQGSFVPTLAAALHLPMRTVEPEPWAFGVRLRDEPEGVHRLTIAPAATAEDRTIAEVAEDAGDIWISVIVRDQQLIPVTPNTRLRAGDEIIVLADPGLHDTLTTLFTRDAGKG